MARNLRNLSREELQAELRLRLAGKKGEFYLSLKSLLAEERSRKESDAFMQECYEWEARRQAAKEKARLRPLGR